MAFGSITLSESIVMTMSPVASRKSPIESASFSTVWYSFVSNLSALGGALSSVLCNQIRNHFVGAVSRPVIDHDNLEMWIVSIEY
jgi:hypothetical protein